MSGFTFGTRFQSEESFSAQRGASSQQSAAEDAANRALTRVEQIQAASEAAQSKTDKLVELQNVALDEIAKQSQRTAEALESMTEELRVPGAALHWFGEPPDGWIECAGADVLKIDYPVLFNLIAGRYDTADTPSGSFRLPAASDISSETLGAGWKFIMRAL